MLILSSLFQSVQAQACSGNMCYPTVNTQLYFGNNDRGNCHTLLDMIETDMWNDMFIVGRTQSISLMRGGTVNYGCLSTDLNGEFAGFVTRFSGATKMWSKFFEGTNGENVIKMPWVGLSKSVLAGD